MASFDDPSLPRPHDFVGQPDSAAVDTWLVILPASAVLKRHYINEERRRIARDVHDGVAQEFTAIITQLRQGLSCTDSTQMAATLDAAHAMAQRGLTISRDLLETLRLPAESVISPQYEDLGHLLGTALTNATAFTHLNATVVSTRRILLERRVAVELARITREAAINAIKHANAGALTCSICLEREEGRLSMVVTDDGRGFNTRTAGYGWGIRGMRERARSIGGRFSLKSHARHGTTVTVKIDVSQCTRLQTSVVNTPFIADSRKIKASSRLSKSLATA